MFTRTFSVVIQLLGTILYVSEGNCVVHGSSFQNIVYCVQYQTVEKVRVNSVDVHVQPLYMLQPEREFAVRPCLVMNRYVII